MTREGLINELQHLADGAQDHPSARAVLLALKAAMLVQQEGNLHAYVLPWVARLNTALLERVRPRDARLN